MFKEGFFYDIYQFFYKLFENVAKNETGGIASFLAMFTYGSILVLLIIILVKFAFIIPRHIKNISDNLEKIRYLWDDDKDE